MAMINAYKRGVRITVTISPKASAAIDRLLALGLYGRSRAAVVQEFIYLGLRQALPPVRLKVRSGRA